MWQRPTDSTQCIGLYSFLLCVDCLLGCVPVGWGRDDSISTQAKVNLQIHCPILKNLLIFLLANAGLLSAARRCRLD